MSGGHGIGLGKKIGMTPSQLSRLEYLENNEYEVTYFEEFSATTGTVTVPTGGTILLNQFAGGVDAYVSTVSSSQPTGIFPVTSGGVDVDVSSFDASGNFTLTGTPSAYPIAIIYVFKIPADQWQNVNLDKIVDYKQTGFQPYDSDLTAIAGLTPTNDDILQRKSGAWTNRTMSQLRTDLGGFGTSAGTFAEGNDSRLSDARNKKIIAYNNETVAHTGNTTETIVRDSLLIPANTMAANSVLEIISQWNATGVAGNKNCRIYLNTTNNLSGSPQLIGTNQMTAAGSQIYCSLRRRIVNKNSISANNILPGTGVTVSDDINSPNALTALNWDFSADTYVICTMQLGSAADTGRIQNIQIEISMP